MYSAYKPKQMTQWAVILKEDEETSTEMLYGFSKRDALEIADRLNEAFERGYYRRKNEADSFESMGYLVRD